MTPNQEDMAFVLETGSMPALLDRRTTEVRLSSSSRFAAMNRVSARAHALAEARKAAAAAEVAAWPTPEPLSPLQPSVLVFNKDPRIAEVAREAFPEANVQTIAEFGLARSRRCDHGSHGLEAH